jgi:magnesium chelatase subunit ChlD-like protein
MVGCRAGKQRNRCRATLLVDMELAPVRVGRAQQLAEQLQADYRHIEQFDTVN